MKIVTVVGARPQFIKAAAVSRAIRAHNASTPSATICEVIVHTGQHYDSNMSQVFFDELDIPVPAHHLGIGGGRHGEMTGRMLGALEQVMVEERPEWVLVYGDTNSTLAAALASVKLHIPVAHVEAGLRSFNMRMPEEVNRIVADRVANLLFCPTTVAVDNLKKEGARGRVEQVGDVMYDASLFYRHIAQEKSRVLERLGLRDKGYALFTCHRAENTDDPARLGQILKGMATIAQSLPVVFPVHPRTRKLAAQHGLDRNLDGLRLIEPVSFLDMVRLEISARAVATDSGGVQKEAFFYKVPCLTLRNETEWTETVSLGWNTLCGADAGRIVDAWRRVSDAPLETDARPYGDGRASERIVANLLGCQ